MKAGLIAVVLAAVVACSGCCSVLTSTMLDSQRSQKALRLQLSNRGAEAGFDLMALTDGGYRANWKQHPGYMAGATIGDGVIGAILYKAYEDATDKDDSPEPRATMLIQGDNNEIHYQSDDERTWAAASGGE